MTQAIQTWAETAPRLIAVAAGREPADTIIRKGQWVNVHSREILPDHDVAIAAGRIAYVGPDASHCAGPETEIIEAEGRFMIPGLCDGHMHIESGMLTPAEFAREVIPHGTTSMFTDPHEIANVLGMRGVDFMLDNARKTPFKFHFSAPSCVPATPFETAGAELSAPEIKALLQSMDLNFGMDFPDWPPENLEKLIPNMKQGCDINLTFS